MTRHGRAPYAVVVARPRVLRRLGRNGRASVGAKAAQDPRIAALAAPPAAAPVSSSVRVKRVVDPRWTTYRRQLRRRTARKGGERRADRLRPFASSTCPRSW